MPNTIKPLIPYIISIALFIEAVDTTIINTAIPVISKYMHTSPINLKIALISYLLSLAMFIPISGWIADKFGQKKVFITAMIIFTFGSIACGMSSNLWELVIARFIQGLGGALMVPVGRLIIVRSFEKNELINAMNQVIIIALIGPAIGPLLGGIITQYFSWRWIFFVNIPFGLFGSYVAYRFIEDIKEANLHRLDQIGFILFGVSLALFVFALSALSEHEFSAHLSLILMIVSLIGFAFYYFHSRTQANPIFNIKLFTTRSFRISVIGSMFIRITTAGVPFLLPLLFQLGLGYTPTLSGILLLPSALGAIFAKRFTTLLLRKYSIKYYLIVNTFLLGLSLISLSFIKQDTSIIIIIISTFILGILISMQYSGMNPLAFSEMPKPKMSNATSITSTVQQIAISIGVAFSALLVTVIDPNTMIHHIMPTWVVHETFIIQGILTILSLSVFLLLDKNDGRVLYS